MSYHMIVAVPVALSSGVVDTKVEIQIRTIAMDFWASLEHKIYYKFEGKAPSHIRRELKECADLVSFLDRKMLSINEEVRMFSEHPYPEYGEAEHTAYKNPATKQNTENSTELNNNPTILDADYIEETVDVSEHSTDSTVITDNLFAKSTFPWNNNVRNTGFHS